MSASHPRVLLFGKNGQLGIELHRLLAPSSQIVALDIEECDLEKPDAVRRMVRDVRPSIIINASAYTDVERAEQEPEKAQAINAVAPAVMAEEAVVLGTGLIHYSTDYVFDGTKGSPYTEDDANHPLNAYGRSKLEGEKAIRATGVHHLILRTSWLYGTRGKNFLLTILRLADERSELRIVCDQSGAPTWSRSLAEGTVKILERLNWQLPTPGRTYHATAGGHTSWYGFAAKALSLSSDLKLKSTRTVPIPSSDYPTNARRPVNSRLSNERLHHELGVSLPNWEEDLQRVMAILNAEGVGKI
jgi:dTDP-4-dehydrorhamnose reductase